MTGGKAGVGMGLAGQILIETAARGAATVLVAPGLRISGRDFALIARNMALHLVRRGIGRGALIAVRSDDLVVSLGLILASGILGCRWGIAGRVDAPDLVLDTAPTGEALTGAIRIDDDWAVQPMPEAEGMFPGLTENAPWLMLDGKALSEADLQARFRGDAGAFDRVGAAVAGLGGPEDEAQIILALSTLHHAGVLVESADPAVWQAEGVVLVAGRPGPVAECLADWTGPTFRELRLWGRAWPDTPVRAFDRVTEDLSFAPETGADLSVTLAEVRPELDLLDHVLRGVEGILDAITFMVAKEGQPDRLTAFIKLAPGADWPRVTSEARIAALRLGGETMVPKRFLTAERLPRLADGRPDRDACRDLVLNARAQRSRLRKAGGPGGGPAAMS